MTTEQGYKNCVTEASRDSSVPLKVRGVGRVLEEPRALLVMLSERPTDDEIRSLHEFIRDWQAGGPQRMYRLEDE